MLCPESLTPQPVQEHLDSPRALLDRGLLCRVLKALLFHSVQKDRRFVAAGVGEDRLAAWREELRDEISEGRGVLALVQDICGDNELEGAHAPDLRLPPVESEYLRFQIEIRAGVVGRKLQCGLVVVCSQDFGAPGECHSGREPDAAPELDSADTRKVAS